MDLKSIFYSLLKLLLTVLQGIVGAFIAFLVYVSITDYNPDKVMPLEIKHPGMTSRSTDSSFSFLIWNTGYAGLGKEMDFFYDGGIRVRPTQAEFQKYQGGILNFLGANDSLDFILLQEVDQHSKRSYFSNQSEAIENQLPAYSSVFSKNYDVAYVPTPPSHPMGKVSAGMMTLSGFDVEKALRLALPQLYSWPMKHFMLDRAAIATHHPLTTQKDLVLINVHNSAYVDDSSALAKEIAVIKNYAQSQYQAGNYVVIGGDWNQNPPGFDTLQRSSYHQLDYQLEKNSLGKNWKWAWDKTKPTNRSLKKPLKQGVNKTIIDFYAISPNLFFEEVKVLPLEFIFSDHEPVYLRVSIPPRQKNRR